MSSQYPIYLRSMFIAPKGKVLIQADLSQAESWCVAYFANEPSMKDALKFGDIHTETAMSLFDCKREDVKKPMRYIGKRCNHAKAYRMKFPRMTQVINKDSDKPPYVTVTNAESRKYSEAWERKYCFVPLWWRDIENELSRGRTIRNPYGREITFYEGWGEELFKQATAAKPQSTVADHFYGMVQDEVGIEGGLLKVYEDLQERDGLINLINTAHDSLVAEVDIQNVKEAGQRIKEILYRPMVINGEEFSIPVDLEYGERFGEMEKLEI
jgi:DNA polymerase I-like protein with 3'-5' exonuclease and polymerase domains